MFNRFGYALITILFSLKGYAYGPGQVYLEPIYPEYSSSIDKSQIELLDAGLQKELVNFSDRRNRAQAAQFAHMTENEIVQNDSFVMRRIMDRSFNRLLKSDYFRKSSVGQNTQGVRDAVDTNMTITGEGGHKFNFKLAAFQRQAFIQYSGFTKAQLRYDLRSSGGLALVWRYDFSPFQNLAIENTFTGQRQGPQLTFNYLW